MEQDCKQVVCRVKIGGGSFDSRLDSLWCRWFGARMDALACWLGVRIQVAQDSGTQHRLACHASVTWRSGDDDQDDKGGKNSGYISAHCFDKAG